MLKKTIKFKDLDGNPVEKDFYFHISTAKLVELDLIHNGGFREHLQSIIDSNDGKTIIESFKDIVKMSYGQRSEDGLSFMQSDELSNHFMGTDAYTEFFLELVTNSPFAAEFINAIVPADLEERSKAIAATVGDGPKPVESSAKPAMSQADLEAVFAKIKSGELNVDALTKQG